jgi:hypothetical protein
MTVEKPLDEAVRRLDYPAGQELERVQTMNADVGAAGGVGDQLDLGALGVVAQTVLGDRGAGAVAGDAQQARAIVGGDLQVAAHGVVAGMGAVVCGRWSSCE